MQPVVYLSLLLVAASAASASQSVEQPSNTNSGEYSFEDGHQFVHEQLVAEPLAYYFVADGPTEHPLDQLGSPEMPIYHLDHEQQPLTQDYLELVSGQPQAVANSPAAASANIIPSQQSQSQPQQVVGNSPVVEQPSSSVVVVEAHQQHPSVHHNQQVQPQQHQPSVASYYSVAPAGLINVVGAEQPQGVAVGSGSNKPQQAVARNFEQYGQPESAGLPPNYKPFGSWGLYIGGNPADGYYTNYYKALSNSVSDKPQVVEQPAAAVKPVVSQAAALSPLLRQASSSPYIGADYYPFAYSTSDLNSAARVAVEPLVPGSPVPALSPVQAGAQVYGSPASFESNYANVSPYADAYATKKVGAAYAQKEVVKEAPVVVQQPVVSKGYQSRVYVYPAQAATPTVYGQQHHQPSVQQHQQAAQVVAYPVPVGSQIVGSQAGVDGAFAPYGVHAFTRYAVKPAVVNQEPSYYYSVHQPATYKQQQHHQPQQHQVYQSTIGPSYYPLSYYGYPLSQLHYSQFQASPGKGVEQPHVPVGESQYESVADKSVENMEKNKHRGEA